MVPFSKINPLAGLFLFKTALGAAVSAIVWTWLFDSAGGLRGNPPLLPVIFAFALPTLLAWIPLTIGGAFFARPQVRRLIAWIPGVAVVILIVAWRVASQWLQEHYQIVLGIGVISAMQVGSILLNVSEAWLNGIKPEQRSISAAAGSTERNGWGLSVVCRQMRRQPARRAGIACA